MADQPLDKATKTAQKEVMLLHVGLLG